MQATHTTNLIATNATGPATRAHVFPDMTRGLVSIGQLCDADCTAHFTKNDVTITHQHKTSSQDDREVSVRIMDSPVNPKQQKQHYSQIPLPRHKQRLRAHNQNCICTISTSLLLQSIHSNMAPAINAGYFGSWPELNCGSCHQTLTKIRRHRQRASTTTVPRHKVDKAGINTAPRQCTTGKTSQRPTHEVYAAVHEATGQVYTDQTGRFPAVSSRGYKYIMILLNIYY